jgi:transposase
MLFKVFNGVTQLIRRRRKYKINFYKINRVRKEILIKNLYDKKLIELIQNERKLNLILDNAQIHKAEVTRIVADILNINLVYLPIYSPFLNPIEKVWADIKREFYMEYYESVNDIIEVFEKEFYERVNNTSYFEKWGIKYFDIIFW